jgi:hypothetical protein
MLSERGWEMLKILSTFALSVFAWSGSVHAQCEAESIGSLAGSITDIDRVGDLVYAANSDGGMAIYDVSDLTNPFLVGDLQTDEDLLGVGVSGRYAYFVSSTYDGTTLLSALVVIDVLDPTDPVFVSRLSLDDAMNDIAISGDYAYVIGGRTEFSVVDISNPSEPAIVATINNYQSEPNAIVIQGDYAFLADRQLGLAIVNISDPHVPVYVSSSSFGTFSNDVEVSDDGNTAFVGDLFGSVGIFDISDRLNPVRMAVSQRLVNSMNGIALDGNRVYGFGGGIAAVLDVADLSSPVLLAGFIRLNGGFGVEGLFGDNLGVIAAIDGGLITVDYNNAHAPVELGRVHVVGVASSVQLVGDAAMVSGRVLGGTDPGIRVIDKRDPAKPIVTGAIARGVLAVDGVLGTVGSAVYDFTDALMPELVGEIPGLVAVNGADVENSFGYYVTNLGEFKVADLNEPASATVVGEIEIGGSLNRVAVSGTLAAVSKNATSDFPGAKVHLIDASDPLAPVPAGSVEYPAAIRDVSFVGLELLGVLSSITSSESTLSFIDLSNIQQPAILGTIQLPGLASRIELVDGYVAVMTVQGTVEFIDISIPASPFIAASISVPGGATTVQIEDGLAHFSLGYDGYSIVDISGCLPEPGCIGDIAGMSGEPDGVVNFDDFLALLGLIGPCPGGTVGCTGDIADDFGTLDGGDGQVSFGDFLALLGLIGACP